MADSSRPRPAWNELMTRIRPSDTVDVRRLDRFRRNFDERVRIQEELTEENVWRRGNQGRHQHCRRQCGGQALPQDDAGSRGVPVESTSERIKAGLDRVGGRRSGRQPALTPVRVEECWRMFAELPSGRWVVRIMKASRGTMKQAIELDADP